MAANKIPQVGISTGWNFSPLLCVCNEWDV